MSQGIPKTVQTRLRAVRKLVGDPSEPSNPTGVLWISTNCSHLWRFDSLSWQETVDLKSLEIASGGYYSTLTPDSRATFPHRSKSCRSTAAKASAPSPTGARFMRLICSVTSGD